MNLRDKKIQYITKLRDGDFIPDNDGSRLKSKENILKAIELGIDCWIDNEHKDEDIPIVITGIYDEVVDIVLEHLKEFLQEHYPNSKDQFEYGFLLINGSNSEQTCINLIKQMRRYGNQLLYKAGNTSCFKYLPEGLLHVVQTDKEDPTRGYNKKEAEPEPIKQRYDKDSLISELFISINHGDIKNSEEADQLFYDEANTGLIRPIFAPKGTKFNEKITIDSPKWMKLACVALLRYQKRECNDGARGEMDKAAWKNIVAYPVFENLPDLSGIGHRQCLVGLVTMNLSIPDKPKLLTVWIHPFYRRKGVFKRLWNELTKEYGLFHVDRPNKDMKNFLKKVGHPQGGDE